MEDSIDDVLANLIAEREQLKAERDRLKELIYAKFEDLRTDGKTILDFYACWYRQDRNTISKLQAERDRLEAEAEHYRKTLTGKVSRELYLESIEEQKKEILRLEAEVDRLKTAIKTFSDKWQYYDSKTIAGLDELRQAISGGR